LLNPELKIYANGAILSTKVDFLLNRLSIKDSDLVIDNSNKVKQELIKSDNRDTIVPNYLSHEIEPESKSNNRDSVFISYAHKDQAQSGWHERLELYLSGIPHIGQRRVWQDGRIQAGAEWRKEIQSALSKTKVAVLLIGPYFLNSSFINEEELPNILKAAEDEGVKVFPIITHHVPYKISKLGKFQAFNPPETPLEYQKETGVADKIIVNLVNEIAMIFGNR